MELSRICAPEIFESSNCTRFHPPPVSELLLGGIDNSPSKNSSEIEIPLSIDNPSKKRRNWGEGNGTIHWRTITRGGKDYPHFQAVQDVTSFVLLLHISIFRHRKISF
jgi:hypothetical protein